MRRWAPYLATETTGTTALGPTVRRAPNCPPSHDHVTGERRALAAAPIGRRRERGVWWEGVGRASSSVSGGCCLLWRRAPWWPPKVAEVDASAGLCPLLVEGRGLRMKAGGRVRQWGGALSFFLGNTLLVPTLASPRRLRPTRSGLGALWRRLVELLPGCSFTQSRRRIPLLSQHSGKGGPGVLETPFCLPMGNWFPSLFSEISGLGGAVTGTSWALTLWPTSVFERKVRRFYTKLLLWVGSYPCGLFLSCAAVPRVGKIVRDRKLLVSCCSAHPCGRGLCASYLEKPLYLCCPYLSDGGRCKGWREGRGFVCVMDEAEGEEQELKQQ